MSRIGWDEPDELKKLFVGRSVTKVDDEHLQLSDGTRVKVVGNADCCAYYDLTHLAECDNIITNVEVYADPDLFEEDRSPGGTGEGIFRLFVFAGNEKINLAEFEGTDSSGYYGTGFWIEVEK